METEVDEEAPSGSSITARVVTPAELVQETIVSLPALSVNAADLQMIMTLLLTYVGWGEFQAVRIDPSTALVEIELLQGWKKEDILDACDRVTEGLAEEFADFQARFLELSGTEIDLNDLQQMVMRYEKEREEQAQLARLATARLQVVASVAGQVGIPNPDPGLVAPAVPIAPRRHRLLVSSLHRVAAIVVDVDEPKVAQPALLLPGWTTPAILGEDKDWQILNVVQRRLATSPDIGQALTALRNMGYNQEKLTTLLSNVSDKARKQLQQSAQILRTAEADFQGFESKLSAIKDAQGVLTAIRDFFSV